MQQVGRLKKRADFLLVQKAARKWVSQSIVVQVRETGAPLTRFGLTVSKQVDKRAVIRNRARRRLRAAAYDVLPLHAKPGLDIVLIGRQTTAEYDYTKLCADLKWCLKKMDLLAGRETCS